MKGKPLRYSTSAWGVCAGGDRTGTTEFKGCDVAVVEAVCCSCGVDMTGTDADAPWASLSSESPVETGNTCTDSTDVSSWAGCAADATDSSDNSETGSIAADVRIGRRGSDAVWAATGGESCSSGCSSGAAAVWDDTLSSSSGGKVSFTDDCKDGDDFGWFLCSL